MCYNEELGSAMMPLSTNAMPLAFVEDAHSPVKLPQVAPAIPFFAVFARRSDNVNAAFIFIGCINVPWLSRT